MILTDSQNETLIEIVNIAFGRAASSLSELTQKRVLLEVPQVSVRPIEELVANLGEHAQANVAAVHQEVLGSLPGDALLVQSETSGVILSEMLTGSEAHGMGVAEREVLNEIGNILLHACVGTLGTSLGMTVRLKPPQVYVDGLDLILERIMKTREQIQWGLIISTQFRLAGSEGSPEGEVMGHVMMLLSVHSLDKLLGGLDRIA